MQIHHSHPWDVTPEQAIAIQHSLRAHVLGEDQLSWVQTVAGVDVGFEAEGKITRAAVAVLRLPELELQESAIIRRPTTFPYVPGLLSFREVPAILEALSQLQAAPDLLVCDGQGFAHPRRFGLACHLGVLTGWPSIGVAKSLLIGHYALLGDRRGDWQPLTDKDEVIGAALRTRPGTKPVFVSIGHRVSLRTAITLTLDCTGRFRLPEPTRQAHHLASN